MNNNDSTLDAELHCRWLGYELHDGLLQWLVGARLHVDALLADSQHPVDEKQRMRLEETLHCILSASEEGRALIAFLEDSSSSPTVDVGYAISGFLSTVNRDKSGNPISAKLTPPKREWPSLPQRVGWNILRVIQQAVRNSQQHAQATAIEVQLDWHDSKTLLARVRDDGIGFDDKSASERLSGRHHFGLASMRHRARMLGGELMIESSRGGGCLIQLTIPIPR